MKIINRDLLKEYLNQNKSEYISEQAVHVFFSMYGKDHDKEIKKDIKNEKK